LREGITCSDGSPLTASDVAANVDFVADPANQSPLLGLWVQPGVTTSADDAARTVTVTAGSPDPFLLQGLALLPIVCAVGMADRYSLASSGNGTGMFTLEEAGPGERYAFQRRDDYAWGPDGASASDPGTPATVIIRVVPDESTAVNLFLSGEVDLLAVTGPDQDRITAPDVRRYDVTTLFSQLIFNQADVQDRITAPDVRRYDVRTLFSQLIFNQADGRPGADPAVRRALVQAVDWDEVGAVMTGGKGQPPTGLGVLEPKVCPADTVTGTIPPHDPAAAATVLDDAGWVADGGVRSRDGEPLALTLVYSSE